MSSSFLAAMARTSRLCRFVRLLHLESASCKRMAERVGFEPTIPVKVCPLSRRIVSTAHAPLRNNSCQLSAVSSQRKATANDQRLTAVFKERLQQLRRTSG